MSYDINIFLIIFFTNTYLYLTSLTSFNVWITCQNISHFINESNSIYAAYIFFLILHYPF